MGSVGGGGWGKERGPVQLCIKPAEGFWRGGLLKGTQHIQGSDGIPMMAVELLLVATS